MSKIIYCYHHGYKIVQTRMSVVRRLAAEKGYTVETVYFADNTNWREIIAHTKPVGAIIDYSGMVAKPPRKSDFGRTPFVLLDADPAKLPATFSAVYCSGTKAAALAARELLHVEHASYVYLKTQVDFYWNKAREKAFAKYLAERGIKTKVISCRPWPSPDPAAITEVVERLVKLPRPIGIFASNDQTAEAAYKAAETMGLVVGSDISIVGVDNRESICENCIPRLTSIEIGVERTATLALSLLEELIQNPSASGLRASFDAIGIVRRASCRLQPVGDHRVDKGIAWIGEHIAERICVDDVARAMECSRSLAELRFRKTTGKSILETIRETRRMKAKILMRAHANASPDFIAAQVGYTNRSALWKLLKD